MKLYMYIKDRALLLLAWIMAFMISLLVIYLDLETGQSYVRQSSFIYAILLGFVCLTVGIILDYIRQREWYMEMRNAMEHLSDTDFILCLQHPVTIEQQKVYELLTRQYRAYMSELLQSVDEETERLGRGLEMMLNTARLEKFELDLKVERVSLQQVIRQVINQHKKTFIRTHLFPKIIGDDVIVVSDQKWLQFILTQFVTNAIKYSREQTKANTLEFIMESTLQGAHLHVRDEGIGIAEHDLPRVFEAFFTGENGRKEGDATGMGLYLVKQVCTRLGHAVSVESIPGEGTTFTLEFISSSLHHDLSIQADLQFLR